jgi:pyruvate/2-oxoglutarate dehydrogenase complex dihydrolipoamide dehydrogenase (E3) component
LIPREDPDAAALITTALRADGVNVRTGVAVREVTDGRVLLDGGDQVEFDRLLVAVGRSPRTRDLGLEAAGVHLAERGFIHVDAALRTTNRRIWAAGDLTGHPQFTHTAGVHASLAASNAVLGLRRTAETRVIPRITFTHPEVAGVGISPEDATGRSDLRVLTRPHTHVDRAIAEAETDGYTRLVVDRKSRIVGATIVGPRAGESLAELVLAIREGMTTRDLAATMHAYPTYADGPWNAAIDDVKEQLATPRQARPLRAMASVRRRWLNLRS